MKKSILGLILFFLVFSMTSCSNSLPFVVENVKEFGRSIFDLNKNDEDMTVIFFDDDNIVSSDGLSFERPKRQVSKTIGSSDCYMIKSGTTEILVDCGYQSITSYGYVTSNYLYNDEYVRAEMQENLLKKIATVISSDGILDYLIVTHADYDHIAGLIATGGLFDCFLNHEIIEDMNGNLIKFEKINYIIDFDSGLVKKFSDEALDKSSRLVRSDYYQAYVHQRYKLVENGTSYCPASAFFVENEDKGISKENKEIGIPDAIKNRIEKAESTNSNFQYVLDENYDNNVETIKNDYYKNEPILNEKLGALQSVNTVNDEKRYYYSIKFNDVELRILYNWHYDYIFHSSFNRDWGDMDSTQSTDPAENVYDSQDANNISVCFEIVKNKFKFLSLGDLGGNGENGLLKYYDGTNVLSNVSLFKVSHHGSIYNGENSKKLFSTAKPKIIVITGCAIYKDPKWKTSEDDPVISAMVGRTKTNQQFFNNVAYAFKSKKNQPYIMCTNINSNRNDMGVPYFESNPFYGDIKIRYKGQKMYLSHSYIGPIDAYISQKWNSDYYHENHSEFNFSTRKNNKIISFQNTEWFKNIGFTYGGK